MAEETVADANSDEHKAPVPSDLLRSSERLLRIAGNCFTGDTAELIEGIDSEGVIEVVKVAREKLKAAVLWSWNNNDPYPVDDLCKAIAILRLLPPVLRESDALDYEEELNPPWDYALQAAADLVEAMWVRLEAGKAQEVAHG